MALNQDELAVNEQMRLDPSGIPQPWYTWPALDVIQSWDVSNQTVLEYGGGRSTIWWSRRCKLLFTIDNKPEWCEWLRGQTDPAKTTVLYRPSEPGDQDSHSALPEGCQPDIVIVDGSFRHECIRRVLTGAPRPFTLIVDNWNQEGVYRDAKADSWLKDFEGTVYPQPNFKHAHAGLWQTGIWTIR